MSKSMLSRRQFMNRSLAAAGVGAGFAIGGTKSSGRVIGANETVRMAVAGLNGRGSSHVGEFVQDAGRRDQLTWSIPTPGPTPKRLEQIQEEWRPRSRRPRKTSAACWMTSRSTPSRSPRPITGTP